MLLSSKCLVIAAANAVIIMIAVIGASICAIVSAITIAIALQNIGFAILMFVSLASKQPSFLVCYQS
jgi:hypothetical protein